MDILKRHHVQVLGHGRQPLVFVNGLGCDQSIWQFMLPALSDHFKLILYDHLGTGHSDYSAYEPGRYASLQGYTQDLLDICTALKLQRAWVIGHSVGATLAMLASVQRPEAFEQMILLCPSPCYLNTPGYHGGFEREELEKMLDFLERDFSGWSETFVPFIMGNPDRPSLATMLLHSFCQHDSAMTKRFAHITFMADNRAEIARVTTPSLIIQCADDLIAPTAVGDYLHDHLPHSQLVTLPVSGHCPHVSAPSEVLSVLDDTFAYARVLEEV